MENVLSIDLLRGYLLEELSGEQNLFVEKHLNNNPEYYHLLRGLINLGCEPEQLDKSKQFLEDAQEKLQQKLLELLKKN